MIIYFVQKSLLVYKKIENVKWPKLPCLKVLLKNEYRTLKSILKPQNQIQYACLSIGELTVE